jgi:pyruvate kinase
VADVTNAVLDGASALMLLSETSDNKTPENAVKSLLKIIESAEYFQSKYVNYASLVHPAVAESKMETCAYGAIQYVLSGAAKLICLLTHSGASAFHLFKFSPPCLVVVVSDKESVVRQLNVYKGFFPIYVGTILSAVDTFRRAFDVMKKLDFAQAGDHVACISGGNALQSLVPATLTLLTIT